MSDQWMPEELRRLIALRPQVCEWGQCDNRTANERTSLMGGDPDDGDNYALIRECADHDRIRRRSSFSSLTASDGGMAGVVAKSGRSS